MFRNNKAKLSNVIKANYKKVKFYIPNKINGYKKMNIDEQKRIQDAIKNKKSFSNNVFIVNEDDSEEIKKEKKKIKEEAIRYFILFSFVMILLIFIGVI